MSAPNLVIIISGPAGAGKTTLCDELLRRSDGFVRLVTCTSRAPRAGEMDGRDYHFLSEAEFQRRIQAGDFLEYARVYGSWYGSPLSGIADALRQGKDLVLNIDVQGAATIRARAPQLALESLGTGGNRSGTLKDFLVTVFIMPPSVALLEERLKKRATDDAETIRQRLAVVREEMRRWVEYDYVIVTGELQNDFARLQAIVTAEKMKTSRLHFQV